MERGVENLTVRVVAAAETKTGLEAPVARRLTCAARDIKLAAMSQLPDPARFVPYEQLGAEPHIIVDGAPTEGTVLTLSHWPGVPSPPGLAGDTSTDLAFAYLDQPELHSTAGIVSNNHFDEDGLFGMYCLIDPPSALAQRELLAAAATAGDFGVVTDRNAARICFAIESFTDPRTSPLPVETFSIDRERRVGDLYRRLLETLPELLSEVEGYRAHWQDQDDLLTASRSLLEDGSMTIEERPELDLAIVRIPPHQDVRRARRYLADEMVSVHPFAVNTATSCTRVLRIQGRRYELEHRYETWVRLTSRRPPLRVAFEGLCQQLNDLEPIGAPWRCEPVGYIVPRLHLHDDVESGIEAERVVDLVCRHLETAPVGWNPYNSTASGAAMVEGAASS